MCIILKYSLTWFPKSGFAARILDGLDPPYYPSGFAYQCCYKGLTQRHEMNSGTQVCRRWKYWLINQSTARAWYVKVAQMLTKLPEWPSVPGTFGV